MSCSIKKQLCVIIQTMRPSFLLLTPVCIFLGVSTAAVMPVTIDPFLVALILMGATAAHMSVNTLNEYYDFTSGLDLKTTKTQFSGGSGALPAHPDMARSVLCVGIMSLTVTIAIGFYFAFTHGMRIMPIGLIGVLLVVTYTQWLNRVPLLCLLAPGLGFGTLMIVGTHVILTGEYSLLPFWVSLAPFFLINNLLLLNQYPDIKADSSVHRSTFPIAYGINMSNIVYGIFVAAAYASILMLIVQGALPRLSLIALTTLALSLFSFRGAVRMTSRIGEAPRYMAANVAAAILTPILLGVSIILS